MDLDARKRTLDQVKPSKRAVFVACALLLTSACVDDDFAACDPDAGEGPEGLLIEMESINPVAPFTFETTHAGYSGEGYLQWPYSQVDSQHGIDHAQEAILEYEFEIGQPGTYLFEVRGRRDRIGWCEDAPDDACNDVWIAVDDAEFTKKMVKHKWGKWDWNGKWDPENGSPFTMEVELCKGVHSVSISGRSNGVSLDALRIYRSGSEPPAE